MLITGLVLATLAALLHGYIFALESFAWASPAAQRTFGHTAQEAERTRFMAFNQGFYNLFLALLAVAGVVAVLAGATVVGLTLVFAGVGSMLAAALVLGISSPPHRSAALKQGALPLLALIALTIHLL
ncbi:DUF1304 domain-containing protein [Propioniciclava soli]|uniref:DUF1304 domain-containing protein n=1 Tax=Propioniciclava soli TaxID=2775081 RepID=A0ABZ3C7H3_9ACTN